MFIYYVCIYTKYVYIPIMYLFYVCIIDLRLRISPPVLAFNFGVLRNAKIRNSITCRKTVNHNTYVGWIRLYGFDSKFPRPIYLAIGHSMLFIDHHTSIYPT